MHQYTWKIMSVDAPNNSMIVEYAHDTLVTSLNIPIPAAGSELPAWVDLYAPVEQWRATQAAPTIDPVAIGTEGTGTFEMVPTVPEAQPASETPNVAGSVNEEYLRALIYQVLEEIKDTQV